MFRNMLVPASPYFPILQHSAKGQLWYKHVAGVPVKWARVNAHSRLSNMPSDNSSADISSLIWLQSMYVWLLLSEWDFLLHLVRRIEAPWKEEVFKGESRDLRRASSICGVLYELNECQEWFVVTAGLWQVLLTPE